MKTRLCLWPVNMQMTSAGALPKSRLSGETPTCDNECLQATLPLWSQLHNRHLDNISCEPIACRLTRDALIQSAEPDACRPSCTAACPCPPCVRTTRRLVSQPRVPYISSLSLGPISILLVPATCNQDALVAAQECHPECPQIALHLLLVPPHMCMIDAPNIRAAK